MRKELTSRVDFSNFSLFISLHTFFLFPDFQLKLLKNCYDLVMIYVIIEPKGKIGEFLLIPLQCLIIFSHIRRDRFCSKQTNAYLEAQVITNEFWDNFLLSPGNYFRCVSVIPHTVFWIEIVPRMFSAINRGVIKLAVAENKRSLCTTRKYTICELPMQRFKSKLDVLWENHIILISIQFIFVQQTYSYSLEVSLRYCVKLTIKFVD